MNRGNGFRRFFDVLLCVTVIIGSYFAPSISSALEEGPLIVRAAAPEVVPSEIKGTIRLNGFTGDASQIRVYAIPGAVMPQDGMRPLPDPRAAERSASLTRTGMPNEFTFSIKGLQPHKPYSLGVEFPPNPVRPKVFWRGLMGGIAMSGAPPVMLEGFIARTEVEIRDSRGNWVGADDLQYDNPEAALRTLRWKSAIPGTAAGEIQISTRAFPIKGAIDPCAEPEGAVIYRKQFPVRNGSWQEIGSLDFGQILRTGRTVPPGDEAPPGILPMDALPEGSTPANDITIGEPSDVSPICDRDLKMLSIGAPLYVRVVPVTEGGGRACNVSEDGVHGWVILAKVAKEVLEVPEAEPSPEPNIKPIFQEYTPPKFPELESQRHPNMSGDSAFYVIKEHKLPPCKSWDSACKKAIELSTGISTQWGGYSWEYSDLFKTWYISAGYDPIGQAMVDQDYLKPNTILPVGYKFAYTIWYTPGSCSGWCVAVQMFNGLVTGAWTGLGDLATLASEGFESIKDGVAEVAADVVTSLPVISEFCKTGVSCKDVIKGGMEIGLMSMGLPPSLPNWNEIKDQGMDYLAAEIATEAASATGLPQEVANLLADETMKLAKDMAQRTIDEMTKKRGSENGPGYDWMMPYMGMDPAVWTIYIKKKEGVNLPSNLYLKTRGYAKFSDFDVNPVYPHTFSDDLYIPDNIHVPTKFPTYSASPEFSNIIKVPVVLLPDFSSVPPPRCLYTPGYGVKCFPNPNPFNIPVCLTSDGYSPFKPVNCEIMGWGKYIAVYYRDYWIDNRLLDTDGLPDCFNLWASAWTKNSFIWLPYEPPFVDFAVIPTDEESSWDEPFYWSPKCQ